MNLNGIYTVKANGKLIAQSHNAIMPGGFQLVQKMLINIDNKNIKKVDVLDNKNIVSINSSNYWQSIGITTSSDVFSSYDPNCFVYPTSNNDLYFDVVFKNSNNQKQKRKISAIGIDFVCLNQTVTQKNNSYYTANSNTINANLYFQCDKGVLGNLSQVENIAISPIFVNSDFSKHNQGYSEKIYYFDQPLNISQLKIWFNKFNTIYNYLPYRIYAINLYEEKNVLKTPNYITLYKLNEKEEQQVLITKPISIGYIDNIADETDSNVVNYSIVYKTTLQFDQLNSTDSVYSVSVDYIDDEAEDFIEIDGKKHVQFSHCVYPTTWQQQAFTTIQLQYQLYFTNNAS